MPDKNELDSFTSFRKYIYNENNAEWECEQSSISDIDCCPINLNPCKEGEDCIIDCNEDVRSCQGYNVDATDANSLNLTCSGLRNCQEMTVDCPLNGECNINCIGQFTCSNINVNHTDNSMYQSINSSINIGCYGNQTCLYSSFNINESTNFNMQCVGQSTCQYMDLYSYSVDNIQINCERIGKYFDYG